MKGTLQEFKSVSQRLSVLVFAALTVGSAGACFLFSHSNGVSNSNANKSAASNNSSNSTTVPDRTSPPANLIETLHTEMRATAPGAALERHPASKLIAESCEEISFAYYDAKGNQTQYIALYRCPMEGAGTGISKFDSQVTVIGEIRSDNGTYFKRIVSAQASN